MDQFVLVTLIVISVLLYILKLRNNDKTECHLHDGLWCWLYKSKKMLHQSNVLNVIRETEVISAYLFLLCRFLPKFAFMFQ